MTKSVRSVKQGFTLLEILLVVGIISILAGIIILAINPTKQLGDTRNAQRRSDVLTILNALYQYSLDNNGAFPDTLVAESETCDITGTDAIDLDPDLVTASSTYLTAIPTDPSAADPTTASEYYAVIMGSGRITVCAPLAANDNDAEISVTR